LDFIPVISGVILKEGGILSHVAIVCRELKIPCIIGVDFDNYIDDELPITISKNKIIFDVIKTNKISKANAINNETNYYKLITSCLKNKNKNYTLKEIADFYNNTLTYSYYLKTKNLSEEKRIQLYIKHQIEFSEILQFLKSKLKDERKLKNKNILGIHIKAILDSQKIKHTRKEVELFGFNYGWLYSESVNEKNFSKRGKIVLNKLKPYKQFKFAESKDALSQYAKYYEWRKLIWMKLSQLIKNIKKEKIIYEIKHYDYQKTVVDSWNKIFKKDIQNQQFGLFEKIKYIVLIL